MACGSNSSGLERVQTVAAIADRHSDRNGPVQRRGPTTWQWSAAEAWDSMNTADPDDRFVLLGRDGGHAAGRRRDDARSAGRRPRWPGRRSPAAARRAARRGRPGPSPRHLPGHRAAADAGRREHQHQEDGRAVARRSRDQFRDFFGDDLWSASSAPGPSGAAAAASAADPAQPGLRLHRSTRTATS